MIDKITPNKNLTLLGIFIITVFSLFYCYDYLLQVAISVFLPEIKRLFLLTNFELGLIGSVFFISYVLMQIPGGYLIDHYGAWKVSMGMSVFCALGALVMYFSIYSYHLLLLSRLLIGLGSSIAFLCAISVIAACAPLRLFSIFVGVLQALAGIGAIVGQSPIAYLNKFYYWNKIALLFFVLALGFIAVFALFHFKLSERFVVKSESTKPNFKDILRTIKSANLMKLSLLSFISWSPVASLAGFWLVPYLREVNGMSIVAAGAVISLFWVGVILGSILIPLISEWQKRRKPVLVVGFILQFVSILMVCFFVRNHFMLMAALFFLGFISPLQGFCIVLAKDSCQQRGFGVASGVINMFGAISGGLMQFVVGFLLTYIFKRFLHPFAWSFGVYLILALLGIYISAFLLRESHPARKKEELNYEV